MTFLLISSMLLSLLDQLQIFPQLYLTAVSRVTRAVALDISKADDRVLHTGLLHKLKSYGISGPIFGLISFFLSNRCLRMVLDKKSFKNTQLMLEFLKGPFLFLHFSCCRLMTFLMMLSVTLPSMLMTLLFILTVTRRLICGNNLSWLLNLNLIYETLWTGVRSGLLISTLQKLS